MSFLVGLAIENEEVHLQRFVHLLEGEMVPLQAKLAREQFAEYTIRRAIEQFKERGKIISGPYKFQEGIRLDGERILCRKAAVVIPRTLQNEITAVAHRLTHAGIQKGTKYIMEVLLVQDEENNWRSLSSLRPVCAKQETRIRGNRSHPCKWKRTSPGARLLQT